MLKDFIWKNINIVSHSIERDIYLDMFPRYHGMLEIWAHRNGECIHYDKQDNVVTVWAKHATMHLLTSEVFSDKGKNRDDGIHVGDTNTDGTLVSGEQYFSGDSINYWSSDNTGDPNMDYGHFPSKMLFGTGKEGDSWGSFTSDEQTYYTAQGWTQSTFNDGISGDTNDYSNSYSAGDSKLNKRKSINDMTSETLVTPTVQDTDFGVTGAIKHGVYESVAGDSGKLTQSSGNWFLSKSFSGIGHPCFLYAKRDTRFYESGSEVALSFDDHIENKITFTVSMPEQTGSYSGDYYPYNGFILKEAGLFVDARFMLKNTQPADDAGSDDTPKNEWDNWSKMPYGMLFSKRYIAPTTKSHDVSITARWTIYL